LSKTALYKWTHTVLYYSLHYKNCITVTSFTHSKRNGLASVRPSVSYFF